MRYKMFTCWRRGNKNKTKNL